MAPLPPTSSHAVMRRRIHQTQRRSTTGDAMTMLVFKNMVSMNKKDRQEINPPSSGSLEIEPINHRQHEKHHGQRIAAPRSSATDSAPTGCVPRAGPRATRRVCQSAPADTKAEGAAMPAQHDIGNVVAMRAPAPEGAGDRVQGHSDPRYFPKSAIPARRSYQPGARSRRRHLHWRQMGTRSDQKPAPRLGIPTPSASHARVEQIASRRRKYIPCPFAHVNKDGGKKEHHGLEDDFLNHRIGERRFLREICIFAAPCAFLGKLAGGFRRAVTSRPDHGCSVHC